MRLLEHLIPPPLVGLLIGIAMWAAAHFVAPLEAPRALRIGVAGALVLAGLACAVAGFLTFRRAGANIDPHRIDKGDVLVTEGVYRYTRNPMYLGVALILFGYGVYLIRPVVFLGPVAFLAYITRFQILPEERAMRAKFGARYEAYARAVRRWI
jgi:protein-S-isoprenylcysteine O-methyltransferase Ste14